MSPRDGRIKDGHYIYMVLEYGEIDLAHMVAQKWKERNNSNMKIDENWLRFYLQVPFILSTIMRNLNTGQICSTVTKDEVSSSIEFIQSKNK
jgi:hypothetical protein